MEDISSSQEKYLSNFTYAGKELSVDEAKEVISNFMEDSGSVDLKKDVNGIAKICLNNPRSRNAMNAKMMIELDEAVNKLYQWTDCKGVILHGADGNFCSGGDLNLARRLNNAERAYAMATFMNDVLEKLRKLPMITVAYIEGTGAVGGGAELTTACDFRLMCSASEATSIGFVHAKMGIVPAWGSTGRLISLVGPQKALKVLLDSRPLSAAEAMDAGLVDDTALTLVDAVEWLSHKVRHDVNVIKAVKRTWLCYVGAGLDRRAAASMERNIVVPLWGGSANRTALAQGFKHKR